MKKNSEKSVREGVGERVSEIRVRVNECESECGRESVGVFVKRDKEYVKRCCN